MARWLDVVDGPDAWLDAMAEDPEVWLANLARPPMPEGPAEDPAVWLAEVRLPEEFLRLV